MGKDRTHDTCWWSAGRKTTQCKESHPTTWGCPPNLRLSPGCPPGSRQSSPACLPACLLSILPPTHPSIKSPTCLPSTYPPICPSYLSVYLPSAFLAACYIYLSCILPSTHVSVYASTSLPTHVSPICIYHLSISTTSFLCLLCLLPVPAPHNPFT